MKSKSDIQKYLLVKNIRASENLTCKSFRKSQENRMSKRMWLSQF